VPATDSLYTFLTVAEHLVADTGPRENDPSWAACENARARAAASRAYYSSEVKRRRPRAKQEGGASQGSPFLRSSFGRLTSGNSPVALFRLERFSNGMQAVRVRGDAPPLSS